ncbi:hypothetical protein NITLEN_20399 [Nitrospira lenta]|uniref:Uncharacterized protein n=1 Tax=Nitrospira lenta TaxID=1436998 RepID=A0A330LCK3_9BACT|nr:hypothetical protein NITLEN_20399 [Nitrospira lenta]
MDDFIRAIGEADIVIDVDAAPVDIVEANVTNQHDQWQSSEKGIVLKMSGERFYRSAARSFSCQDDVGGIVDKLVQRDGGEISASYLKAGFGEDAGKDGDFARIVVKYQDALGCRGLRHR